MSTNLNQIIVIDVESTCWEGVPPPHQQSEIIEIGVCALEVSTGERLEKESILVKPQRSEVSEYCTKLTTLTQADVDTGMTFSEACKRLREKFDTRNRTWASYGDYDRRMFEQQCFQMDVAYPFGATHINIKNLLGVLLNLKQEVGMDKALELLDMPLVGTHHRGGDDASNNAAILSRIILEARNSISPKKS